MELRNLVSGETRQGSLDFIKGDWQAGKLIWSPEGTAIVFTVLFNPCGPADRSSVYRMDVATGNLVALVEEDERVFVAREWLPDGKIALVDSAGAVWQVDADTRVLRKIE